MKLRPAIVFLGLLATASFADTKVGEGVEFRIPDETVNDAIQKSVEAEQHFTKSDVSMDSLQQQAEDLHEKGINDSEQQRRVIALARGITSFKLLVKDALEFNSLAREDWTHALNEAEEVSMEEMSLPLSDDVLELADQIAKNMPQEQLQEALTDEEFRAMEMNAVLKDLRGRNTAAASQGISEGLIMPIEAVTDAIRFHNAREKLLSDMLAITDQWVFQLKRYTADRALLDFLGTGTSLDAKELIRIDRSINNLKEKEPTRKKLRERRFVFERHLRSQ